MHPQDLRVVWFRFRAYAQGRRPSGRAVAAAPRKSLCRLCLSCAAARFHLFGGGPVRVGYNFLCGSVLAARKRFHRFCFVVGSSPLLLVWWASRAVCWSWLVARCAGLVPPSGVVARLIARLHSVARARLRFAASALGLLPATRPLGALRAWVSPSLWSGLPRALRAVWSRSLRSRGLFFRLAHCYFPFSAALAVARLPSPPSPVAGIARSSPWSGSCSFCLFCAIPLCRFAPFFGKFPTLVL